MPAIVAGCRGTSFDPPQQARDPLLEKLNQPPVNLPAKRFSNPPVVDIPEQTPLLPPGNSRAYLSSSNGRLVSRALSVLGNLTTKAGLIQFTAEKQPTVHILYRLPPQLPPLPQMKGPGSVAFVDRTTPGGPARQLIVSADGTPLLGEVWLKSPDPITVELGLGLQLRQRSGPTEGIHNVAVEIVQMKGAQLISVGVVTTIKTPRGPLDTLVEASYVANSSDPTGQYPGGYILHAWVVRSGV